MFHISEVDLEPISGSLLGPIRIALVSETARAELQLCIIPVADTSDFRFDLLGDKPVQVIRGENTVSAAEFFTSSPPKIWLADGALLEGNEYTPLKTQLPPYSLSKLIAHWNWAGVDIRKESQGEGKEQDSVQAAVIARLMAGDYCLIFDDDGAGEAADIVAVSIVGTIDAPTQIEVELYHCKYSKKSEAGARVDDLYVVCGQAQTSIRWMASGEKRTDLFTHLLRRERQRQYRGSTSRIERGDDALIEILREMSRTTRVTMKIFVVQPGVSKAAISEQQLRLLSVTENYLTDTYQIPFGVVVQP